MVKLASFMSNWCDFLLFRSSIRCSSIWSTLLLLSCHLQLLAGFSGFKKTRFFRSVARFHIEIVQNWWKRVPMLSENWRDMVGLNTCLCHFEIFVVNDVCVS